MAVQLSLSKDLRPQLEHGGALAKGRRKTRRPIVTKRAMHLVLRACEGRPSFFRYSKGIHSILSAMAKKFHVETCERAICGNHIHLAVRARDRKGFLDFLRAITGRIAQFVQKSGSQKLWESIPYTRIIAWGRHLKRLLSYIRKNALEAEGIIPYQPRTHRPRIPRSKLSKNLS